MNTNGPDTNDVDRDMRLQAEAESAERAGLSPGSDPEVDRHRLIVRALRRPLEPQLPDDFAVRVARLAAHRSGTGVEDFLVTSLLLVMGIAALLFLGPALAKAAQVIVSSQLPAQLSWRPLGTAAVCIGLVWMIDSGWMRKRPVARGH
jgi:hypothetical protein